MDLNLEGASLKTLMGVLALYRWTENGLLRRQKHIHNISRKPGTLETQGKSPFLLLAAEHITQKLPEWKLLMSIIYDWDTYHIK